MNSSDTSRAQLKVFSSICSGFVVVWITAVPFIRDYLVLTVDIIGATLAWYFAIEAEKLLEQYD